VHMRQLLMAGLIALGLGVPPVWAEEKAPEGKPLREILQGLEAKGYSQVAEAIFRKGKWKIEAYKDGDRRILQVDPKSGDVTADRKDDDD
jgi:hypothetical protein